MKPEQTNGIEYGKSAGRMPNNETKPKIISLRNAINCIYTWNIQETYLKHY